MDVVIQKDIGSITNQLRARTLSIDLDDFRSLNRSNRKRREAATKATRNFTLNFAILKQLDLRCNRITRCYRKQRRKWIVRIDGVEAGTLTSNQQTGTGLINGRCQQCYDDTDHENQEKRLNENCSTTTENVDVLAYRNGCGLFFAGVKAVFHRAFWCRTDDTLNHGTSSVRAPSYSIYGASSVSYPRLTIAYTSQISHTIKTLTRVINSKLNVTFGQTAHSATFPHIMSLIHHLNESRCVKTSLDKPYIGLNR